MKNAGDDLVKAFALCCLREIRCCQGVASNPLS